MKKALKIIFTLIFSVLFCLYIANEICKLPINTDASCMLLEADSVLKGNILLSGWHLTGVSFITTDLPWYIIGVAIFGVGLNAYRAAVFGMYIFMILCAMPLVFYKVKNKLLSFFIIAGIGIFPTTYALSNAFVHTAVFGLTFLSVFFIIWYNDKPTPLKLAAIVISIAMASGGDHTILATVSLPAIILCLFKGLKKPVHTAAGVISGSALGIVIEKLYLFIGGANYNSYYTTTFAKPEDIPDNIRMYAEYFLKLINASFFGKEIFSVKTFVFALKILIALFALYIMLKAVINLIKRTDTDSATAIFGIGFSVITLMLWLTTLTTNITTGRYIAFLPLMLAIVLARNIDELPQYDEPLIYSSVIAVCAGLMLASILPHGSSYSPENRFTELAEYLESENLEYGYSAFWDSAVINAYSEDRVKVRAIKFQDGKLMPRVWFCRNDWYNNGSAKYVIVRDYGASEQELNYNYNNIYTMRLDGGHQYEITKENVITYLGEPTEIKTFKNYSIMIYNDITLDMTEMESYSRNN